MACGYAESISLHTAAADACHGGRVNPKVRTSRDESKMELNGLRAAVLYWAVSIGFKLTASCSFAAARANSAKPNQLVVPVEVR